MDKKKLAIAAMFLTTILTSTAQILYKSGVNHIYDISLMLKQGYIISPGITIGMMHIESIALVLISSGLILYAIGAAIMIKSLKYGNVSTLYPIIATSYIWVSIASSAFFNETMNLWKWLGVAVIVLGVSIISYGSKKDDSLVYAEGV
jgi:drug/metabolite transporter (DMT)-like permease